MHTTELLNGFSAYKNVKKKFIFYFQRQDTDERLRRLQTEKESMALQVQVLTEQVSAQSDKIADLERIILDKTHQLSQSEDLLQRVHCFSFQFH